VGAPGVGAAGVPPPSRAVVARVALHCRDLLFGSKVEGALRAAGHEVTRGDAAADIVIVDLTDPDLPWPEAAGAPRLGFYSHVDQETRRRAEEDRKSVV
jgi:hypothetical protein